MKPNGDHPNQFSFSFAPTITPRGDGSFIVIPGKPILEDDLTVRQFALQFHVNEDSVYRWIREAVIPEEYVRPAGMRRLRIASAAIPLLKEKFKARHE